MSTVLLVDIAPGEIRAGRFDGHGRALALYLERASERFSRARVGALYAGRVRRVDKALDAAFVDLGTGVPGFLPLRRAPMGLRVFEGAALAVRVHRAAIAEKGPQLGFAPDQGLCAGRDCPSLLAEAPDFLQRIRIATDEVNEAGREGRERLDAAFEAVLEPHLALPGGGALYIEPTRALVAIDVDTGGAPAPAVNAAAIEAVLQQLDLRGLGGIIAIDFAPVKGARARKALEHKLAQAVAAAPEPMEMAPLSRFGVALLTRRRNRRSLAEIMLDESARPSAETLALAALRALENAHRADPAPALCLEAAPAVIHWLQDHRICWQEELMPRLGGRLELRQDETLCRDQFEVIAR